MPSAFSTHLEENSGGCRSCQHSRPRHQGHDCLTRRSAACGCPRTPHTWPQQPNEKSPGSLHEPGASTAAPSSAPLRPLRVTLAGRCGSEGRYGRQGYPLERDRRALHLGSGERFRFHLGPGRKSTAKRPAVGRFGSSFGRPRRPARRRQRSSLGLPARDKLGRERPRMVRLMGRPLMPERRVRLHSGDVGHTLSYCGRAWSGRSEDYTDPC